MIEKTVKITMLIVFLLAIPPVVVQSSRHLSKENNDTAVVSDLEQLSDAEMSPARQKKIIVTFPIASREQFYRIQGNMTQEQCLRIMGVPGEPVDPSESGAAGTNAMYRWYDESGANQFTLGFRDGRLSSRGMNMTPTAKRRANARLRAAKANTVTIGAQDVMALEQAALGAGQNVVITLAEYQQLHTGMTYPACVQVIGVDHPMGGLPGYTVQRNAILSGQTNGRQTLSESLRWENPGGYGAEISFYNGRMTGKAWKKGGSPSGRMAGGGSGSYGH